MGKMITLKIMRHTFKEYTLPDEMEISWDVSNNQEVMYAEKKFREYLADGWLAYSDDNKKGRIQIFNFNPKLEMIVLMSPLGGG